MSHKWYAEGKARKVEGGRVGTTTSQNYKKWEIMCEKMLAGREKWMLVISRGKKSRQRVKEQHGEKTRELQLFRILQKLWISYRAWDPIKSRLLVLDAMKHLSLLDLYDKNNNNKKTVHNRGKEYLLYKKIKDSKNPLKKNGKLLNINVNVGYL